MVIISWKSTFMVPRLCAGAISARYSGATCTDGSLQLSRRIPLAHCNTTTHSVQGVRLLAWGRTLKPHAPGSSPNHASHPRPPWAGCADANQNIIQACSPPTVATYADADQIVMVTKGIPV